MNAERTIARIRERLGPVSEDAFPRCVFDGKVCTGDSTIQFARIEQIEDAGGILGVDGTPRGAHVVGMRYYTCDNERECEGRFLGPR